VICVEEERRMRERRKKDGPAEGVKGAIKAGALQSSVTSPGPRIQQGCHQGCRPPVQCG
jgi:hypothetical protein